MKYIPCLNARVHNPKNYPSPEHPKVLRVDDVEIVGPTRAPHQQVDAKDTEATKKKPIDGVAAQTVEESLAAASTATKGEEGTASDTLTGSAWGRARPFPPCDEPQADAALSAFQLSTLHKARALVGQILGRMPPIDSSESVRGVPAAAKGGVHVHREGGGCLSMSVRAHQHALAEMRFDLHMVDSWHADVAITARGLGTGLLPFLSLFFEPDLVAEYLPKPAGLPYIENLDMEKSFADNDIVYHCFVSPFGPLPGADDVHSLLLFDLMDEEERGLLFYAESPEEGTKVHRGWDVPQVKSWRRKRNYVLGSTILIRPSEKRPIELEPPAPQPERCATPGCRFYAHRALSVGAGRYCCARCRDHPGKHGKGCARCDAGTQPPPRWALATHGTIDVEIYLSLKPPIPTWLIPLAFCRWVLKHLIRLVYPYFLLLNEQFEATPFAERVAADTKGIYRAIKSALGRSTGEASTGEAGPRFVCRVDEVMASCSC